MKFSYSLNDIIKIVGECKLDGHTSISITGIASLQKAQPTDLSFLGNPKYKADLPASAASVILVHSNYEGRPKTNQAFIRTEDPSYALLKICHEIETLFWPLPDAGIHPSAVVSKEAIVSDQAYIGPFCVVEAGAHIEEDVVLQSHVFIGRGVRVGEGSHIASHVSIHDFCEVGKSNYINSGAVIGSQGFGYATVSGEHFKEPQIGKVILGDHVDLGANTTIDRARFSQTHIGNGTKIDNLVQIAHNVTIGEHCLIVSQTGIAGSTKIEDHVVLGGQVGVVGHITIGAGSMVGAQSGVNHNLEPKSYVRGSPAYSYVQAQRLEVYKRRLPEVYKRLSHLEELVGSLTPQTINTPDTANEQS